MNALRILAIDTSGKTAAVAVADEERLLWEKTVYTDRTHSQVILPMVSEAMKELGLGFEDIDLAAIAKGPGSYTGLRIGCAAVKGMCLGQESLKAVGISTLESLCYNCLSARGVIAAVMYARPGICYAGIYSSDGRRLENIRRDEVIREDELSEAIGASGEVILVGDYAAAFKEKFFADNDSVTTAPQNAVLQRASSLCLAAAAHIDEAGPADELSVAYLQQTKAQKDRAHSQDENGKDVKV